MKIIGHRGARGLAPENTLAGFDKAIKHGVDGIELDVRISKDGATVLTHNKNVTDPAGNKLAVRDHTLAELCAHKPDLTTLDETLAYLAGRVPIIIEVKPGENVVPVIATVRSALGQHWDTENIAFISFDFGILKQLHAAFPGHRIMVDEMWSGIRAAYRARRLGSKDISLYAPVLWSGFIRAVSRHGYHIHAFPLNNTRKAQRWAKYGLASAITDYPDRFEH